MGLGIYSGIPGSGAWRPYSPLRDPGFIDLWDWSAVDAARNVVAGTIGAAGVLSLKNAWPLRQTVGGAMPTFSLTALTDPLGGSAPGVVFGGAAGLFCDAAGYQAAVAALSGIEVYVLAAKNPAAANTSPKVLVEHGADVISSNTGFAILLDDTVKNTVEFIARGAGLGYWRCVDDLVPLADLEVLMCRFALPGTGGLGSTSRRLADLELQGPSASATAAGAGTFAAASNLNVGARNGGAGLTFTGVVGGVALFATGTDAQTSARARWLAGRYPTIPTVA